MKDDVSPSKAMIRRSEIVEEIVDHLRPWGKSNRAGRRLSEAAVTSNVNSELDILLRSYPRHIEHSDRRRNRAYAQKLDSVLAEVERLEASAPIALASFFRERADSFATEVRRRRKICAHFLDPKFGHHPNYDVAKHMCAGRAFGLMEMLSDKKITSAKDSTFRAIASLLYEAVSEERGVDLKRACDDVLREIRDISRYRLP
jgi:hypothetical protein